MSTGVGFRYWLRARLSSIHVCQALASSRDVAVAFEQGQLAVELKFDTEMHGCPMLMQSGAATGTNAICDDGAEGSALCAHRGSGCSRLDHGAISPGELWACLHLG